MSTPDEREHAHASQRLTSDPGAYHFQVTELRTLVITGGDSMLPQLHVRSLTAMATKDALDELVKHYAPGGIDVTLTFDMPGAGPGADVVVQASRWMFKATIRTQLRLQPRSLGVVTLELLPGRKWSPADLTMLAIIHRQIAEVARERSEIVETGSRSFEIDLQYLINDVLNDGELPIRWGAMLSDIQADAREIRFHFTPVPDLLEVTAPETT